MSKRETLLEQLNQASFALIEAVLFLDTHPCDEAALHYYHSCVKEREKAMYDYTDAFGPILIEQSEDCGHWSWIDDPWPWEKGGNC